MTKPTKGQPSHWAVGLCFAASVLTCLEALHPGSCSWMGLSDDQSFGLSATIATLTAFLAAYLLTEIVVKAAHAR